MSKYPSRIVCLTEETTETLYLLGQGDRIVGVSGYTVRPPEARQKPKVSAFINAKFDKIQALNPDLVLAFSDLQADLTAELVRRGLVVERDGAYFSPEAVAEAGRRVASLLAQHPGGVTVSQVRDELGTTRKHALPLLAHLDATGVTRRRGDVRIGGPRLPTG